MPALLVRVVNGMTNRMYSILSNLAWTRREHRPLTVYWLADADCPGEFASVFNTSLLPPDLVVLSMQPPRSIPEARWVSPLPDFGRMALDTLQPTLAVQARIDELLGALQWPMTSFAAVHVRHSDMDTFWADHGGASDAAVLAWAAKVTGPLFVAADNFDSLELLNKTFPGRVIGGGHFLDPSRNDLGSFQPSNQQPSHALRRRQTKLEDAATDMWVASFAEYFMGTAGSTFSEQVRIIDARVHTILVVHVNVTQIEAMRMARGLTHRAWLCNEVKNSSVCHGEHLADGTFT